MLNGQVYNEMLRTSRCDQNKQTTQRYFKTIFESDENGGTQKDYYAELEDILVIRIGGAAYTLLRGSWFDLAAITPNSITKTYTVNLRRARENTKDNIILARQCFGMVYIAPDPGEDPEKGVLLDRTADFFEYLEDFEEDDDEEVPEIEDDVEVEDEEILVETTHTSDEEM